MNILILNSILTTAEKGKIVRRPSIKDTMIYSFGMGFVRNGHTVTLIAAEEFKPLKKEEYELNVIFLPSILTSIFKPHLLPFQKGLRSYLKKNIDSIDMVVVSEAFSMNTLLASNICKHKLVIWQEMAMHQKMFFKLPAKIWYNFITRFISKDNLIIPRSGAAKKFVEQYSHNVSNEMVDHGANIDVFKLGKEVKKSFIVLSRLAPKKRIDRIIRNFIQFINDKDYKDYKLYIIGDGPEKDNLQQEINRGNAEENIYLKGFMSHEDMIPYLNSSYAILIDTIHDLNMVTTAESIACGTPVLSNSVPINAPYIKSNILGIIKDDWGESELKEMVKNYDIFHANCLKVRDDLTNVGCTKHMIEIYNNWLKSKNLSINNNIN